MNNRQEMQNAHRELRSVINQLKRFLDNVVDQSPYRLSASQVRQETHNLRELLLRLREAWEQVAP